MVYIKIPGFLPKYDMLLTSLKRFIFDASRSLFLTKWKQENKENVVHVENYMLPEILRIQKEGFENKNPDILIRYSKKLEKIFYIINNQDKIVGYCAYYIKPVLSRWDFKKKSVIYSFAIGKNFRRQGFGEKLLSESIKEMRLNGIYSVLLYVNAKNASAINLYKKTGFQIIRKVKDICSNGEMCYEMELKLAVLLTSTFLLKFFTAYFFDNDVIILTELAYCSY